jgi:hypothetical protein
MREKQVGRRRSRAEVDRLVAEHEASGLTLREFCSKHGLGLSTLSRYRKGRQLKAESSAADSRFIRVELSGGNAVGGQDGSNLIVLLSKARRIEVKHGFDGDLLAQLVRVLEQV